MFFFFYALWITSNSSLQYYNLVNMKYLSGAYENYFQQLYLTSRFKEWNYKTYFKLINCLIFTYSITVYETVNSIKPKRRQMYIWVILKINTPVFLQTGLRQIFGTKRSSQVFNPRKKSYLVKKYVWYCRLVHILF